MVKGAPTKLSRRERDEFHTAEKAIEQLESAVTSLDALPEPQRCVGCGGNTARALIDYEYDCRNSNDVRITVAKALPGYRCEDCQAEARDPRVSDMFFGAIATALASARETHLPDSQRQPKARVRGVGAITDDRRIS